MNDTIHMTILCHPFIFLIILSNFMPITLPSYLQMYGHWERATRLAKSILTPSEASEVILRWVDHLCSQDKNKKVT
jgi:hypothetical protein